MKPLQRGNPTGLVEIPANWYLDDLPPMMYGISLIQRSLETYLLTLPTGLSSKAQILMDGFVV